jgi:aldehyde:ferredoxin oxidoreductase
MDSKLLLIDLTSGDIREQAIDPAYRRDFIGGSGLGARLLWDSLDPARDPLDPASPLLWITGPLTGSGGPTTGRFTLCARSPYTGIWGESNIGGFVGPEIRFAGYDAVQFIGQANRPVYLWLHNGQAELRDASHLWGKADTDETQRVIKEEVGEPHARVACIGIAGENQVPYGCIISDNGRAAGRTGMGGLMGSKNLKALAVRGTGKIPLAREEDYKRLRLEANKALMEENLTTVFRDLGSGNAAEYLQMLGEMPQKYWTQGTFGEAENISGAHMAETILVGNAACQGCVVSCGRVVAIPEGPYATQGKVKGPEYETICSFGSQLLVDDLAIITALGRRCDAVGLDTISAGNTIALAYLLFEKGLVTTADTGGVELHWGDATPCFDLIERIARKKGFGALLAQGAKALAEHFGAPDLAAHVNGLEVPMHDPRALTGMALIYATSPRGACHNQGQYYMVELGNSIDELGIPMTERLVDGGKAHHVARYQDWNTISNCLVNCLFAAVRPSTIVTLLTAATGHDWTLEEMMLAGERVWNLKRAFNHRLGLTRANDKLPKLLLQSLPDGGQEGHVPDMDLLLGEYYAARGWDPASGRPTLEKLRALGLGVAADALWGAA